MLSRYLMHGMIVLLATLALVSGCSRKIVRPNQVPQGPVAPFGAGQISEQELQGVQAELRIVYFDYDKYSLSPEAQTALQYNANFSREFPTSMLFRKDIATSVEHQSTTLLLVNGVPGRW